MSGLSISYEGMKKEKGAVPARQGHGYRFFDALSVAVDSEAKGIINVLKVVETSW